MKNDLKKKTKKDLIEICERLITDLKNERSKFNQLQDLYNDYIIETQTGKSQEKLRNAINKVNFKN